MRNQRFDFEDDDEPIFSGLRAGQPADESPTSVVQSSYVPDGHHGYDAARTVRVTIDDNGRSLQVGLEESLHTSIESAHLGVRVVEANRNAEFGRLEAGFPEREMLSHPGPARPGDVPSSSLDFSDLLALLDRVENAFEKFDEVLKTPGAFEVAASGPRNFATAVFDRGQLVRLQLDEKELHSSSTDLVSGEIQAALAAGFTRWQNSRSPFSDDDGAIAEIHALAADPAQLMRRLGLPQM